MITCPTCGMENAETRTVCAVCREPLPEQAPPPDAPTTDPTMGSDQLPDDEPANEPDDEPNGPPQPDEPVRDEELPTTPAAPDVALPDAPPAVADSQHLPAWLRGAELVEDAPPPATEWETWDDELDFSDLPDWPDAPLPAALSRATPAPPTPDRPDPVDLFQVEGEGSGLLAGVQGPIPIEPVIQLPHDAPVAPVQVDLPQDTAAANLFARIAGGAVVAAPIPKPKAPPRGVGLFYLLLLLAVVVPLVGNLSLFGAPADVPAARAYAATIEALPDGAAVLLAFDYEAGMVEEVEPAAVATLNHLWRLSAERGTEMTLLAVSTTPQGPALAERARARSTWPPGTLQLVPYLPGQVIGLRALLLDQLAAQGQPLDLIVIIANETLDVQRWIEQIGTQVDLPMIAIAPATAETTLTPYLVSGQLDGLVAGLPGTASYEIHGARQAGIAWRRIDAVTLGALLVLLVIVAGNVAARR